jgi:CheY-like chemotaxis protein/HPt (histidine-containing phosphotransfer) domain-containing protein
MEQIGFSAYLTKPVRQYEMYGCLSALLSNRSAALSELAIITRYTLREAQRSVGHILLVEDNLTNQAVALGILETLGMTAEAVCNGVEALNALESRSYDLVLMDVQMAEMDGCEATRRIRDPNSAVLNHAVTVIAMTAHAMHGDRKNCLDAGMDDYITKPIIPHVLAATLSKWLLKDEATPMDHDSVAVVKASSSSAETSELPIFDMAGMTQRLQNNMSLLTHVVSVFLKESPNYICQLRQYLEYGDIQNVTRHAHTIKGAAANVGGETLRAVAREMEKAGKAGDLDTARGYMDEVERQFEHLKEAMENGLQASLKENGGRES